VPETRIPQHNLARHLRVRLGASDGMLRWQVPRALAGIVPIGTKRISVPIGEIESIGVGRTLRPLRLLIGVAAVVVPPFLAPWWVSVPLVLCGLWVILVALGPHLQVETHAGRRYRAGVCFSHQIDAELYLGAVEDLVAQQRRSGPGASAG
jgi:hypothetical protein